MSLSMSLIDKVLIDIFDFQYEGYGLWEVKNTKKVENLIKPNFFFDVRDICYVQNKYELKTLINELPYGWGLYDPENEAYVLTNKFIFDFDDDDVKITYSIPMKKCLL